MKNWFFDIDGTLLDSMPALVRLLKNQLLNSGITPPPDTDLLASIIPIGFLGAAEYLIGLGVPKTTEELLLDLYNEIKEEYLCRIPKKPYAAELLSHLAEEGNTLYVMSAGASAVAIPALERVGIRHYFTDLFFADSFGLSKKDPAIYRAAAARAGVEVADCVFVDDNAENIASARAAGMMTVGVYDEGSDYGWADMQKNAHRTVRTFAELIGG